MLLISAVAAMAAVWHAHELERRQSLFVNRYWDTYLTDYYLLIGEWNGIQSRAEQTLSMLERASGGRIGLTVWDADGAAVFASGTPVAEAKTTADNLSLSDMTATAVSAAADQISADRLRPISAGGRIVGYYQVYYEADIGVPAYFWTALILIAAAGAVCWSVMIRRTLRAGLRPLLAVAARLDRMLRRGDRREDGTEQAAGSDRTADTPENHPDRSPNGKHSGGLAHGKRCDRSSLRLAEHTSGKVFYEIDGTDGVSERRLRQDPSALYALLEDRLAHLEGRLDLLERVRKTMVADIAHELRTPLAVVRAKLENALHRQASIPPEEIVILHDEIYRMSKLIRDLNLLALAESGRLPLERSWFSLKQLMEQLVETVSPEAEEAGITIVMNGFDSPCRIYADRERLQQVFVNLLGNALRYARSTIEISCSQQETHFLIAIGDDGIGIEEEDLPHVFDRFYRSPRSSKAADDRTGAGGADGRSSGLGLGLAIVKEFVQAHGGFVSAESRWNEGSVFKVTLPVFQE